MGIITKIASAIGIGSADAVVKTADGVANIVERWAPSDEKKVQMSVELNKLVESARAYDPRSPGTGKAAEFINVLVDSVTRLIRPTVTIVVFGGLFGWWNLSVKSVDPWIVSWGEDLMAFWFGARTVLKDLPTFIKEMKQIGK